MRMQGGLEGCVLKDDAPFFYNKFMDCDGLIIATPVWTLTTPGYFMHLRDRALGPFSDVAGAMELKKMQGAGMGSIFGGRITIDERAFKSRAGDFISVGGAPLPNWVCLTLPLLHTMTFPPQVAIVDQMQVLKANQQVGSVLLNDKAVKRARQLGRNVAEAMGKPSDEVKYMGDEAGTCPVCHLDLMVVRKNSLECAICGVKGDIKVDGGKITVVFSKEEQKKSRLAIEGKRIHFFEIRDVIQELGPRYGEIPAKLGKYKSYKTPIKPPSKARRKTRA